MPTPHYLIDVRSGPEFSASPPQHPLPGAINIEYTDIGSLPNIIPSASKNDDITLYCRSGRRSAIAMETLMAMGYTRVRDIGSLEAAREIWEGERRERLAGYAGGEKGCGMNGHGNGDGGVKGVELGVGPGREGLERSHRALLEGLRAAE